MGRLRTTCFAALQIPGMQPKPLVQEHPHDSATLSLLGSSWMGNNGYHQLNNSARTLDLDFGPVDDASLYEVGGFGSPELGEQGGLLSASQASTHLTTHSISADTVGCDHNAVLIQDCECISCLGIGEPQELSYRINEFVFERYGGYHSEPYHSCRLPGCLHTKRTYGSNEKYFLTRHLADLRRHEKAHFGTKGHFKCLSDRCTFVTKRSSDLKRHSTVMHCKNAKRFPCPVPYCKFAGDNNGFLRKDKLTSHFKKVHEGVKAAPRGPLRAIKAAPAKEALTQLEALPVRRQLKAADEVHGG